MKAKGNAAFAAADYSQAVASFTAAIEIDADNHILYSNRSAAYAAQKAYPEAITDAEKAISLNPQWSKGYSRKAAALHGAGRLEEALQTYEKALSLDPASPQLKKSVDEVKTLLNAAASRPGGPAAGFFDQLNPFTKPGAMENILKDPSMAPYLAQPDFMQKLQQIVANPSTLSSHLQDSRILQAVMVGMGLNVKVNEKGEKSFEATNVSNASSKTDECCAGKTSPCSEASSSPVNPTAAASSKPTTTENAGPSASSASSPVAPSADVDPLKAECNKLKELGNNAYKARNFEEALKLYEEAFDKDPTNVSILNNKAAVYFEQGDFDACIKACEEAVEKGRELFVDFHVIAKSYARMGSAFLKKDDLEAAITFFQKSLTEHRTPETLAKLKETEKAKVARDKLAYVNPELAEQERNKGNDLFKQCNYAEAMKHYSEAIKRNDKDPRNFSNRAACYTKLMAFPEAMKDCDACLQLDPTFTKAYLRKAGIYLAQHQHEECLSALQEAREHDKDGKNRQEIDKMMTSCYSQMHASSQQASQMSPEETIKKAMQDPEISSIINDPSMQFILQQMQSDPKAIMEHMKNPVIATKIRKLMTAGIIRTA